MGGLAGRGAHIEEMGSKQSGRMSVEQLAETEVMTDVLRTDDDEWPEGSRVWFLRAVCPD